MKTHNHFILAAGIAIISAAILSGCGNFQKEKEVNLSASSSNANISDTFIIDSSQEASLLNMTSERHLGGENYEIIKTSKNGDEYIDTVFVIRSNSQLGISHISEEDSVSIHIFNNKLYYRKDDDQYGAFIDNISDDVIDTIANYVVSECLDIGNISDIHNVTNDYDGLDELIFTATSDNIKISNLIIHTDSTLTKLLSVSYDTNNGDTVNISIDENIGVSTWVPDGWLLTAAETTLDNFAASCPEYKQFSEFFND